MRPDREDSMRCVLPALLLVTSAPAFEQSDAEAVEKSFHEIRRMARARDLEGLKRTIDPGFVMNHAFGPAEPRDVWIGLASQGKLPIQAIDGTEWRTYVKLFGDTAVRGWIVRMRNPKAKTEDWARGTAVFVRRPDGWRKINQHSTSLNSGPIVEPPPLVPFAGTYAIEGRAPVTIEAEDGLLFMIAEGGVETPLIPMGGDKFRAGALSTMSFERDASGHVSAVTRDPLAGGRRWWRGVRMP
jgi:hypothetical protein